jgi:hypothetical protein
MQLLLFGRPVTGEQVIPIVLPGDMKSDTISDDHLFVLNKSIPHPNGVVGNGSQNCSGHMEGLVA